PCDTAAGRASCVVIVDRGGIQGTAVDGGLVQAALEVMGGSCCAHPSFVAPARPEKGSLVLAHADRTGQSPDSGAIQVESLLGSLTGENGMVPCVVGDDRGRRDWPGAGMFDRVELASQLPRVVHTEK